MLVHFFSHSLGRKYRFSPHKNDKPRNRRTQDFHMPERRMLIGFPPLARLQANKHAPYRHSAKYDLNRRWRLYAARMTRR